LRKVGERHWVRDRVEELRRREVVVEGALGMVGQVME
jgi:hypothetical protein